MSFESYSLDPLILDALHQMEYTKPTEIQEIAIPLILQGVDVIGLAETGSGKTAACAIPICHKVDPTKKEVQALIVVPTRELALQYATESQKIGRVKRVRAFALFGGEDLEMQRAKLKDGVQVLIATPGRLIDFIYARAIDLSHVSTLILDEADQMLGMGFYEDLEFIIQCLVHEHQTLLFSATMPDSIRKIAKYHMKSPKELMLISKTATPASLSHTFCVVGHPAKKREALLNLLDTLNPAQCLIFAGSRNEVENLYRVIKQHFQGTDFLHGGLEQQVRSSITAKFSKGKIRILVATDIAARGLDFSQVTHVFNLQLPKEAETYMHRAGRAGRRGREGQCVSIVTSREKPYVLRICKTLGREPIWL